MKSNTTRFAAFAAMIGLAVAGCADLSADAPDNAGTEEKQGAIVRPTATGGRNEVVMLYWMAGFNSAGQPVFGSCSGAYFAPRTVLTAAHCVQNIVNGQLFVYYGDKFDVDVAQLTTIPGTPFLKPPTPGQPSFWSQAESWESHPEYDPNLNSPDLAAVYLDRKLPFDPLPLARFRLDNSWIGKQVTISGWGHNVATSGTTGTGARTQRTGLSRFLGTPTAADYHPEDPNPGMLNPAIRANQFKIDGRAPNSNACFGDSGSPLLITQYGQMYIAGIEYFGGLFCEEYSLYHRIDPYLPFMDLAYMKGGQAKLFARSECIAPRTGGGFRAYFGYDNQNGIAVDIPRGANNSFPQDTANLRPTALPPREQVLRVRHQLHRRPDAELLRETAERRREAGDGHFEQPALQHQRPELRLHAALRGGAGGGVRLERRGLHARLRVELPVPGAVRVVLLGVQQVPRGAAGERVCVRGHLRV